MKQSTRHLIELYMTGVIALGQSAHYIQAWKIFVTQSASDMSLLSYSIYFTLLLHAFGYSILINKKLLMFAEGVGLIGAGSVIAGILLYS
jgi:MtN3 and saliva related transmembrane protein